MIPFRIGSDWNHDILLLTVSVSVVIRCTRIHSRNDVGSRKWALSELKDSVRAHPLIGSCEFSRADCDHDRAEPVAHRDL